MAAYGLIIDCSWPEHDTHQVGRSVETPLDLQRDLDLVRRKKLTSGCVHNGDVAASARIERVR